MTLAKNTFTNNSQATSINFVLENNLAAYRTLILENCQNPVIYPAGTCLSRAGEPIKSMYFLLKGMVKVYTINNNGYIRILGYHKENTIFAMDGLQQQNACVTTEAVTDIKVIPISLAEIQHLSLKNRGFFTDLLVFYGDVLRLMCLDAESQSVDNVLTRPANFICVYMQCDYYQHLGYIPLSQDNLASAINASRIQVARACAELKKAGLISVGRCKLTVNDEKGIREISSF
ncbi:MAG: Crp/Fnr family transcriptional regulator [Firmicutes bacterium]|nr:Crp/Fnr family transcriptional regulator [Bacillota bacterium]